MDNYTILFLVFIGSSFLSRGILNNAYKKLTSEDKLTLIDLFNTNRTYTYIALFVMLVIYVALMNYKIFDFKIITNLFFLLLIIYMFAKSYFSHKKLKDNFFNQSYIKAYLLSTGVNLAGFLVLLLSINFLK